MMLKKRLAREIIVQLYDQKTAAEAEEHFERTVQKKEVPEEIKEYRVTLTESIDLRGVLVVTGLAKSRSEANRLIAQGAVSIDGKKISSNIATVNSGSIIKVGKRRFAKVIDTDISP
jgi:tyrosyl-tRNA synthetase